MRTTSFGSSSKHSRSFDTAECSREPPRFDVGGPMLPVYLNDLSRNIRGGGGGEEMVEVTLELDDNSVVLCSVAPAANATSSDDDDQPRSNGFLPRSTSAASRLRRLFSWRRTPSGRTSTSDADEQHHQLAAAVVPAREIMKMKAKMMRTKSSAQRALGGLRFISRSTGGGESNPDMLWKLVEPRFDILAVDGLLSRHDFGECIGIIAPLTVIDYHQFSMCLIIR